MVLQAVDFDQCAGVYAATVLYSSPVLVAGSLQLLLLMLHMCLLLLLLMLLVLLCCCFLFVAASAPAAGAHVCRRVLVHRKLGTELHRPLVPAAAREKCWAAV